MNFLSGLSIQNGIAYGKVHKLVPTTESKFDFDLYINQREVLQSALKSSTEAIENTIRNSSSVFNETVVMIFEAHKLMVKDPMLLQEAYQLIDQGTSAYEAYKTAANNIIDLFKSLANDYMRNRIIDIEDATDRVLYSIQDTEYELKLMFDQPRILVLPEMKPSMILNCDKEYISGFIVQNGSYDQHASYIARSKGIPGIIISNAMNLINETDQVLLDASKGIVYINPSKTILRQYHIKGDENDEL